MSTKKNTDTQRTSQKIRSTTTAPVEPCTGIQNPPSACTDAQPTSLPISSLRNRKSPLPHLRPHRPPGRIRAP